MIRAYGGCRAVTQEAVIPAHVVTETYAVLTRMPAPFRMDARDSGCVSRPPMGRTRYRPGRRTI